MKQYQALINQDNKVTFLEQQGLVLVDALGGFDSPEVGEDKVVAQWFIFIQLQVITSIVVLNTLIAILGDSYDNVMNQADAYDMRQKVELLIELNDFMKMINNKKKATQVKKFIILIRYRSSA